MKATRRYAAGLAAVVATAASLLAVTGLDAGAAGASSFPAFVAPLHHITTLASTVPANGDVNPYGVAVIPHGTGRLGRGNILVSNFNNKANVQGTGTTIVQITPHGHVSLCATVSQGHALLGELGLVVAPGGDILTVNGGNGNLVEVSPSGRQVAVRALDVSGSPPGAGALFGLAVKPHHRAVYFVDDATNTFALLH
jgi:hypothetical protein